MATVDLTVSTNRVAYFTTGALYASSLGSTDDGYIRAGMKITVAGGYIYRYYASAVQFGNITEAYLANKYFSSLTLVIDNNIDFPVKWRVQTSPITAYSNAQDAYNAYNNGALIHSATGPATITITDSAQIKNILLYGIGMGYLGNQYEIELVKPSEFALSYTYTDGVAPAIVGNLSPSGSTILSTAANRFSWAFYQESGAVQSHYDLQYSYDDGTMWTTLANKVASANAYRDIAANTFSSGVVTWRVRAWTVGGTIASDWVYAQIVVKINPASSSVTCDGKPRPTVTWTSTGQVAYQVRIGDRDSGAVFSTVKTYKSPFYFDDGLYPVTVRVQSSSGTWTAWTEVIYAQLTNSGAGTIDISATQVGSSVRLSWETAASCVAYIVYRNNVPIAQTPNKQYTDHYSNGLTTYKVRGILATGHYVSSISATLPLRMPCDVLSAVGDISWQYLRYSLSPLSRSYDKNASVAYKYYAGRSKPVAVSDGHTYRTMRAPYASLTRAQADAINALVGQTVVYKDRNGDRIIGVLTTAGYDSERVFSYDVEITETDFNEEIAYVDP